MIGSMVYDTIWTLDKDAIHSDGNNEKIYLISNGRLTASETLQDNHLTIPHTSTKQSLYQHSSSTCFLIVCVCVYTVPIVRIYFVINNKDAGMVKMLTSYHI